jgi:diadenosine tetraphosphate (Ap4A) HIT family hydrolase
MTEEEIASFQFKFRIAELTVQEFAFWTVSVRPQQITLGSLIISLKSGKDDLSHLSESEAAELSMVFFSIERLLKGAFSPDVVNYLMLRLKDRAIHLHVFPRYSSVRTFNKKSFVDPYWPNPIPFSDSRALDVSLGELQAFLSDSAQIAGTDG